MTKKYVYDIEVFPNFFCALFRSCDDPRDEHTFVLYSERDDRLQLRQFLNQSIQLIGFNNIWYDGPVLYYLCNYFTTSTVSATLTHLFSVSKRLITDDKRRDEALMKLRYPRNLKYTQLDLMKLMAFDNIGVGLKQTAINLRWHRIQDLPYPYDHVVAPDEVATILDYNRNDVLITERLYQALQPKIKLRQELGALYGLDLQSASDSKIANLLLEKIYAQETGADIAQLKNLRTKHQEVRLADCMDSQIQFQSATLRQLHEELKQITVTAASHFGYGKAVTIGSCTYDLGTGGLHSRDKAAKFTASAEYILRDADVASYYPNIIIRNRVKPAHLQDDFIDILQKITHERLAAKRAGDKVKAEGLKITINSIFGKFGSDVYWLEDAKAMLSVTVSGQLYLLMLIEALELAGIRVISANTDGIVCQIPRHLESRYQEVCTAWQQQTGFALEFTDYTLYVRSDVNNYLTQKADGEIKTKGRYVQEVDLKKGYRYPVIPRCLYEYFIHGKPVEETLAECTDILDFCISQKAGRQFAFEYHTIHTTNPLQKHNRFYVSHRGGVLVKRKTTNDQETGLFVGYSVQLLNDFDPAMPFSEYDVNLDFYRQEALKCIDEIEPSITQGQLFDLLAF